METTLLWLLLIEALTLPHILWLLSKRYRHAVVYTWKVFVLRDKTAKEQDAAACTLQVYRLQIKEIASKPLKNGVRSQQANGDVHGADVEDSFTMETQGASPDTNGHNYSRAGVSRDQRHQNNTVMTTDLDDGLTAVTQLKSSTVVTLNESNNTIQEHDDEYGQIVVTQDSTSSKPRGILKDTSGAKKLPKVSISDSITANDSSASSSTPTSPSKSSLGTPSRTGEVKRSASASSRQEWKERMRKKHLPAIFVNNSFEGDNQDVAQPVGAGHTEEQQTSRSENYVVNSSETNSPSRNIPIGQIQGQQNASTDSTYYMSSDYHYDYLSETLHPPLKHQGTLDSEGFSDMYEADDIDNILGDSAVGDHIHIDESGRRRSGSAMSKTSMDGQPKPVHNTESKQNSSLETNVHVTTVNDSNRVNNVSEKDIPKTEPEVLGVFYDESVVSSAPIEQHYQPPAQQKNTSEHHKEHADHEQETFHGGRPNIRRDNYRKFLSYTDLVVSSVDDVDTQVNETEERSAQYSKGTEHGTEPKTVSDDSVMSKNASNLETVVESDELHSRTSVNSSLEIHTQANTTGDIKTNEDISHALQDYGQLETVSGTEMLHLKMKSVRSATAVEYSDDTTSDEGGIDNKGFDDTFEDDDNEEEETTPVNSTLNLHPQGNNFLDNPESNGIEYSSHDEFSDIPERDGNGDGEESQTSSLHKSKNVPSMKYNKVTTEFPETDLDEDIRGGTDHSSSNQTQESRKTDYATNPFLRQSFEALSQSPDYKAKFQSKKNPFFASTDSSTGSVFSTSVDVPQTPNESTATEFRSDKDKEPQMHQNGSGEVSTTTYKAPKPPVPIVKPPRYKRGLQNNVLPRHTSSEEEMESIFRGRNDKLETMNADEAIMETDGSIESMITNRPGAQDNLNQTDGLETESNGSDHSVVLEPLGRQRPAWMDDSLDSTSSGHVVLPDHTTSESTTDTMTNVNPNPDFRFTVKDEHQDNVVEYDFDSVTIGDLNTTPERRFNYGSSTQPESSLVQYHFDEDIDRGFEDALAVDYIVHSNVYSGMGLCFESIKEEPEDSLSESASSFGVAENGSNNLFKTQAVVSRPSSRASVTGPSPLTVAPSPFEGDGMHEKVTDRYFNHNDILPSQTNHPLPATERTSADGSESVPQTHNGNGVSSHQAVATHPWGFNSDNGISSSQNNTYAPQPSFQMQDDDFETAEDLQLSLAQGAQGDDSNLHSSSPWLDVESNEKDPSLDMSFESDFSQQSSDTLGNSGGSNTLTVLKETGDTIDTSTYFEPASSFSSTDAKKRTSTSNITSVYF